MLPFFGILTSLLPSFTQRRSYTYSSGTTSSTAATRGRQVRRDGRRAQAAAPSAPPSGARDAEVIEEVEFQEALRRSVRDTRGDVPLGNRMVGGRVEESEWVQVGHLGATVNDAQRITPSAPAQEDFAVADQGGVGEGGTSSAASGAVDASELRRRRVQRLVL